MFFSLMRQRPPTSILFPYTTLFRSQLPENVVMELWNNNGGQALRNSAKTRSDGFHFYVEKHDRGGRAEGDQNGARYLPCVLQTENHHRNRKNRNRRGGHRESVPRLGKRLDAMEKIARNMVHL